MPNWCNNHLTITGDSATLSRFRQAVERRDENDNVIYAILHNLYPVPQELTDTFSGFFGDNEKQEELEKQYARNVEKYGYKDWYEWQYAEWGTKWGDCDTTLTSSDDADELMFMFDSAWGPPTEGFRKVSIMFPDLTFVLAYEEQGMGFVGAHGFKAGKVVEHTSENISVADIEDFDPDNDEMWDRLSEAYNDERDKCEELVIRDLVLIS